jgi:hypothetical protein
MRVLFLSPAFPPTAPAFCAALAARGATVVGLGDEELRPDGVASRALSSYVHEPRMGEYGALHQAVQRLIAEQGPFERVDSNGEHWLVAEAKLRDDFGIAGLSSEALTKQRSKLAMATIFAKAGIAYPPTISARDGSLLRQFAEDHAFSLVLKPEAGSGAAHTFRVTSPAELELAIEQQLDGHVAQPFIDAEIVTYDGLADRQGRIVFATSHAYDTGIMQVRQGKLDGFYFSLRELPAGLEAVGQRAVKAFDIRERFFHLECFRHADGSYTALEMNLRPPGGFTTDMMNAACQIDVYDLWARVMTGDDLSAFSYQRSYHTAHVGRRAAHRYHLGTDELRKELGDMLMSERAVPAAFADTMGDVAYLLRHPELEALRSGIELVRAA